MVRFLFCIVNRVEEFSRLETTPETILPDVSHGRIVDQ